MIRTCGINFDPDMRSNKYIRFLSTAPRGAHITVECLFVTELNQLLNIYLFPFEHCYIS